MDSMERSLKLILDNGQKLIDEGIVGKDDVKLSETQRMRLILDFYLFFRLNPAFSMSRKCGKLLSNLLTDVNSCFWVLWNTIRLES